MAKIRQELAKDVEETTGTYVTRDIWQEIDRKLDKLLEYMIQNRQRTNDFPYFDGINAKAWIFKAERYFELNNIEEDAKVNLASNRLQGKAATWHQSLTQSFSLRNLCKGWNSYKAQLMDTFTEVRDDQVPEIEENLINIWQEIEAGKIQEKEVREVDVNGVVTQAENTPHMGYSTKSELSEETDSIHDTNSRLEVIKIHEKESTEVKDDDKSILPIQVSNFQLESSLSLIGEEWIASNNDVLMSFTGSDAMMKKEVFDTKKYEKKSVSLFPKRWKFKFKFRNMIHLRRHKCVGVNYLKDHLNKRKKIYRHSVLPIMEQGAFMRKQLKVHHLGKEMLRLRRKFKFKIITFNGEGQNLQILMVNQRLKQFELCKTCHFKMGCIKDLSKTKLVVHISLVSEGNEAQNRVKALAARKREMTTEVGDLEQKIALFEADYISLNQKVRDEQWKFDILRIDFSHLYQLIQDLEVTISYFGQKLNVILFHLEEPEENWYVLGSILIVHVMKKQGLQLSMVNLATCRILCDKKQALGVLITILANLSSAAYIVEVLARREQKKFQEKGCGLKCKLVLLGSFEWDSILELKSLFASELFCVTEKSLIPRNWRHSLNKMELQEGKQPRIQHDGKIGELLLQMESRVVGEDDSVSLTWVQWKIMQYEKKILHLFLKNWKFKFKQRIATNLKGLHIEEKEMEFTILWREKVLVCLNHKLSTDRGNNDIQGWKNFFKSQSHLTMGLKGDDGGEHFGENLPKEFRGYLEGIYYCNKGVHSFGFEEKAEQVSVQRKCVNYERQDAAIMEYVEYCSQWLQILCFYGSLPRPPEILLEVVCRHKNKRDEVTEEDILNQDHLKVVVIKLCGQGFSKGEDLMQVIE